MFTDDMDAETKIVLLWADNKALSTAIAGDKKELTEMRLQLEECLFIYKETLVSAGRAGKWSEFLRKYELNKTTADRYVNRWRKRLDEANNLVTDEIVTEETLNQLAIRVSRTLKTKLKTPEHVSTFLNALSSTFGELRANSIPPCQHSSVPGGV